MSIKLLQYLLFLFILSLFHYFRVLFLDAYIFMHIYFSLMYGFFIFMKCPSLALVMSLILNFILSYTVRVISGLLKSLSFPVLLLSIYLCISVFHSHQSHFAFHAVIQAPSFNWVI